MKSPETAANTAPGIIGDRIPTAWTIAMNKAKTWRQYTKLVANNGRQMDNKKEKPLSFLKISISSRFNLTRKKLAVTTKLCR